MEAGGQCSLLRVRVVAAEVAQVKDALRFILSVEPIGFVYINKFFFPPNSSLLS